ncbi:hypothetical protein F5890DRAFT_1536243 [Lentinula detonsa]|uniref:Uncharacterized protein n=1 Tax=Lentinula detonsa TaxID=2804962 RepID=A0AA38UQ74_9AGAR|nr:hypothetical protein F5890DRAFT_1536243 [Lentinula detonsa]
MMKHQQQVEDEGRQVYENAIRSYKDFRVIFININSLSYMGKDSEDRVEGDEGALCDVAPTALDLLSLVKPEEMTGRVLLVNV